MAEEISGIHYDWQLSGLLIRKVDVRDVSGNVSSKVSGNVKTLRIHSRVKHTSNPPARRPRAAQGRGVAIKDVTSGSEDDEVEEVEWGKCMYGVRMTPAHHDSFR